MPRKDPEARREYCRQYRQTHKEYFTSYNKKYRAEHLEELRDYDKKRRPGTQRDRFGRLVKGRILGMCEKGTPKATRSPNLRDISWAAGFLEGEGSFHADGVSSQINAAQVQREPLERLVAMFGGSLTQRNPPKKSPHHNPQWRWSVSGARSRGVMMTIYTLMSPRRKGQIQAALNGRPRTRAA